MSALDLLVWSRPQYLDCDEQKLAHEFSGEWELVASSEQLVARSFPVRHVNFMVKLLRAHGGCLGRSRR